MRGLELQGIAAAGAVLGTIVGAGLGVAIGTDDPIFGLA